jgi:hypothetical protein
VDLDAIADGALRLMEEASRPLLQAMKDDRPERAKAPVHGFTCGGAHMLYALLTAVQTGYASRDRAERVRELLDLMAWRLHADVVLIESFYKLRAAEPEAYWYEVDSKLKILGHGAECLAFAVQATASSADPPPGHGSHAATHARGAGATRPQRGAPGRPGAVQAARG